MNSIIMIIICSYVALLNNSLEPNPNPNLNKPKSYWELKAEVHRFDDHQVGVLLYFNIEQTCVQHL